MRCLSVISPCEGACFTERKQVQRGAGPRWAWERHGTPVGALTKSRAGSNQRQESEGVPGLLGHLGLLNAAQGILGGLGGLLHIALHLVQKGSLLGLGSFYEESRTEWGESASGEPLAPAQPPIGVWYPPATCQAIPFPRPAQFPLAAYQARPGAPGRQQEGAAGAAWRLGSCREGSCEPFLKSHPLHHHQATLPGEMRWPLKQGLSRLKSGEERANMGEAMGFQTGDWGTQGRESEAGHGAGTPQTRNQDTWILARFLPLTC